MKIRLTLALLFTFSLGTSAYYTAKAPVMSGSKVCCGTDPTLPGPQVPTPLPKPPKAK